MNEQQLVVEYCKTGQKKLKAKIVTAFAPLIKFIIHRFNITYSKTFSKDDLYQYGVLGLLKALERYQVDYEVPFKSFAYKRIYGEVVDALRKEGMLGRDKYEQVKRLEKNTAELAAKLGREPDTLEICEYTKLTQDEYFALLSTAQLTYTVSLNTKISDDEGDFIYRIDTIVDSSQLSPEEYLEKENLKENLRKIINALPERDRIIMALYFYEELTLADIGAVIGVTEARVSQILSKLLLSIRSQLS
jgi:RNA polymerase sigma factor for flagellar operon FliA